MIELGSTRANPLVDPALHVWAWQIPLYLFLGGLVAGMMVIQGAMLLRDGPRPAGSVARVLPSLGIVLLSVGMAALFLDLEHKGFVWRLYTTFQPASPMSWGAWILLAVYPVLAAATLIDPPAGLLERIPFAGAISAALRANASGVRLVGTGLTVLGGLLGIYTGVLLSSLGARPLWNSALLGPLFLTSGLSGAAALVHLVARDSRERLRLVQADNQFLLAELVILALFLVGLLTSTGVHVAAAAVFLGGPYSAVFWVGIVGLGLIVPLAVQALELGGRVRHTTVAPLLVLVGGILLRFVFVSAGQVSHWGPR